MYWMDKLLLLSILYSVLLDNFQKKEVRTNIPNFSQYRDLYKSSNWI